MRAQDAAYLRDLATLLRDAPRIGALVDDPEGVRLVTLSDTLALTIARRLEAIVVRGATGQSWEEGA